MYHANIIVSNQDCKNFVFEILEKDLNFNVKANPDFSITEQESFGIDDARDLIKWVIGKPLLSEIKVSLIILKSISLEAQNALLKVLEEPPMGTYIFINLESLGGILPTFISRVKILDLPKLSKGVLNDVGSEAQKFLRSDVKNKLAMIRALSKKEDKIEMQELIKNLETVAYQNNFRSRDLSQMLTAKIFASTRGSSPKMILEWLSAVL